MFEFKAIENEGLLSSIGTYELNNVAADDGHKYNRMGADDPADAAYIGTYNIKLRWESQERGANAYFELDMMVCVCALA